MQTQSKKMDDHHCTVIEKDRIKAELADCDTNAASPEDQENCHTKVKQTSRKREEQCKYS